ncbi:hypothetical protein MTO96_052227 [Rhipicephalus appendiculatus]
MLRVCSGRGIRIVDSRYAPIVIARPRHGLRSQKQQEPPRPRSMLCIARPPPPLPIVCAGGMPQQSCVSRRIPRSPSFSLSLRCVNMMAPRATQERKMGATRGHFPVEWFAGGPVNRPECRRRQILVSQQTTI